MSSASARSMNAFHPAYPSVTFGPFVENHHPGRKGPPSPNPRRRCDDVKAPSLQHWERGLGVRASSFTFRWPWRVGAEAVARLAIRTFALADHFVAVLEKVRPQLFVALQSERAPARTANRVGECCLANSLAPHRLGNHQQLKLIHQVSASQDIDRRQLTIHHHA